MSDDTTEETRIPRFFQPTLEDLKALPCDEETREKIRKVLCREVRPADASPAAKAWSDQCVNKPRPFGHEMMLAAVDELLGTHGTEGVDVGGDDYHTDEGIGFCPAFSYCNAGDTYAVTLLRDHEASAWLVASWGAALEEYEQENELGDYAPTDEEEEEEEEEEGEEEEFSEES